MISVRLYRSLVAVAIATLLTSVSHAAAKPRWVAYKSNVLGIQVSVPSDWTPVKIPKALAFRYDDLAGGNAAIGFLKSDQNITIEQAADAEFNKEGRPSDWLRTTARVSGNRAIKIVGTLPKNPGRKMVHYYVETPNGVYLVQCQAADERWNVFSPIFATILTKMKFL